MNERMKEDEITKRLFDLQVEVTSRKLMLWKKEVNPILEFPSFRHMQFNQNGVVDSIRTGSLIQSERGR